MTNRAASTPGAAQVHPERNPLDRKSYAENLGLLAYEIVGSVHADEPDRIRQALASARVLTPPRGVNAEDALVMTLAAMVDPEKRLSELRALWTREERTPVDVIPPPAKHYSRNPIAVEMAVAGLLPAAALNPSELARVVERLTEDGKTREHIARHLKAEPHHIAYAWPEPLRTAA